MCQFALLHFCVRVCVLFLLAHTARAQTAAGAVASASGGIRYRRGAAVATPGAPVNQGDRIVSGVEGVAVVNLSDGSELERDLQQTSRSTNTPVVA